MALLINILCFIGIAIATLQLPIAYFVVVLLFTVVVMFNSARMI